MKNLKIIDIFGEEARKEAHKRLDEFFNSTHGFFIMSDDQGGKGTRVTDLYAGACHNCVLKAVHAAVHDAAGRGLLAEPVGKDDHKH